MYTRSSDGGLSALETPTTSDPIDVDMLSEEEGMRSVKTKKTPVRFEVRSMLGLAATKPRYDRPCLVASGKLWW